MHFQSVIREEACSDQEVQQAVRMLESLALVQEKPQDEFARGLSYFEAKEYELSAEEFLRVPPNPLVRFAWAQEWLGQAYLKLNRHEQAVEALQRALQLHEKMRRDPLTIAECQFSLGLAYARSGHHEMALANFRQALRRAPDWGTIHFEEARVHANRNRTVESLCALSRAIGEDRHFLDKANRDPDFAQVRQSPQFPRLWVGPDVPKD